MEVGWEVRRREPLGEGRWDRGGWGGEVSVGGKLEKVSSESHVAQLAYKSAYKMYQNIFLPSLLTSSNLTTSNLGLSKSICIAVQSTFHTYTSFPTKTLQTLLPVKTGGVGGVEERKEEARGGGRREVKVKEVEVVWEIRREDILGGGILMFLNLMWDKTMVLRNMDIRSARMKRSYIKR